MNTLKNKQTTNLSNKLVEARKNSISEFNGIEHRLELVAEINGVEYVNDSKATDVSSTWYSLECMETPVVWILGESEIETDYSIFTDMVSEKVKAIVYLGENKSKNLDALINVVDCFVETKSIEESVKIASELSNQGEVVLFSPACSSFHLFQNYKDRGEQFRKAVAELK